ncbi:hypothetical protein Hanom_Chr02g00143631 [Helianthus anomalus]
MRTPKVSTPKVVIKGKSEKQESSKRLVDNTFEYSSNNIIECIVETKKKKSPPHLIDETVIPPTGVIKEGADLLRMSFANYEKFSTAQGDQGEKEAENTAENIEEDATYVPTTTEKDKFKKEGIKKRKARPTREFPRKVRARKDTTSIPQQDTT